MSASAITVFKTDKGVVSTDSKQGHCDRLMTAKEFKDSRGVKGQDAKRQYLEYVRANGLNANAYVSALIAKGEIVVKGVQRGKNGGRISYATAASLEPKPVKESPMAKQLADANAIIAANNKRIAELEARQAQLDLGGAVPIRATA